MGGTAATSRTSSSRSAMMAAAMQQLHCTLLHCGSYRAAAFLPAGMAEGSSTAASSSQWLPCHAIRAMPATRARIACAAIRYESQDPRTQQLQAVDLDRPVPACSSDR
jgi:hypothetical protein